MPDSSYPANPLLVSTRNPHKITEIRDILGPAFAVMDLSACPGVPEVEETGLTFEENATLKVLAASSLFDGWVIADDSGLEVDALNGAPGIHSARYAGTPANDAANNALLLKNLATTGTANRTARFRCVIVLAKSGKKIAAFSGTVEGTLLDAPRGLAGFGYDPLFVPQGYGQTFAQLPESIKNALSHRAAALKHLKNWSGWNLSPKPQGP
jgi:XTP/dITP diphosphohydrolase